MWSVILKFLASLASGLYGKWQAARDARKRGQAEARNEAAEEREKARKDADKAKADIRDPGADLSGDL